MSLLFKRKPKSKISHVKRGNQLRTKLIKQGKLKTRRNKVKPKKIRHYIAPVNKQCVEVEDASIHEENVLDMIEDEDISFLQSAVANRSYLFIKNSSFNGKKETDRKSKKLKRKAVLEEGGCDDDDEDDDDDDDDDDFSSDSADDDHNGNPELIEEQYEQAKQNLGETKRKKYLLPIKTSEGIVVRSEDIDESGDESMEIYENQVISKDTDSGSLPVVENIKEVSSADLLACRQNSLAKNKFRIGSLCSGLTENPEVKIKNFKPLLEMVTKNNPEVCITVKKLAIVSLLEVFKDLLPEYQIKHHNDPKVKLKKTVKQLYNYENDLLKYYKEYLQKMEKIMSILKRKKGDRRVFKEPEIKLAETSMKCLCDLLTTHSYFNFSKNVVHLLVPFLNNSRESVRAMVSSAIKEVFKTDKKGEISLEIVKNINKLVKSKIKIVHSEVLNVCLSLKIRDVNLDKEREEQLKKKKEIAMRHRFMKMSKRERKRNKKFQELEKELLETKAEENKKSKYHFLTEITKILFTIYFRILKETPSSKLLNAALEGLAKFAHCINIDFYQDLILVLNNLIQTENLGYKEKLACVQTVFTVLYYQGATINIDPIKFYSHFYVNILKINAGRNHTDLPVILKTTDFVLLKRRKHLSLQRLLAFTKRLTALSLQVLPNGSLALLSSVKQILQVNNSTDLLLDLESGQGQGVYYPELDEPEYCNANATSLWELIPLQRHYHPTVREYASRIVKLAQKDQEVTSFKDFLNQSPERLFEEFDATNVKFNPAVPPPRKFPKSKRKPGFLQQDLEDYIKNVIKKEKVFLGDSFKQTNNFQE